eukprot:CFRG0504T1
MGTYNQKRLRIQENVVTTIWNVDQFSLPYGDNLYSVSAVSMTCRSIMDAPVLGIRQQRKYRYKDIVEVKQTYDEYKRQFKQFVQSVHGDDRHLTVIINQSIGQTKAGDSYKKAYDRGEEKDVFIKTSEGRIYRSCQWAGGVAILDPTSTCIKEYIIKELCDWWKNEIKFDGLWLDMPFLCTVLSTVTVFLPHFAQNICAEAKSAKDGYENICDALDTHE